MGNPSLSDEKCLEAVRANELHGDKQAAADSLNLARSTFRDRLAEGQRRIAAGLLSDDGEDVMNRVLAEECAKAGIPVDDVTGWWYKTDRASIYARGPAGFTYGDMRDAIIEQMAAHAPAYEPIKHTPGEHLLVVSPSDVHIGALSRFSESGADYDIEEAVRRITVGVDGLLAKALPHGVGDIVLAIGNDIMHIDSPRRTTTSGTPQDTDGQFWEMFDHAKSVLVRVIERLVQIAPVRVIHVPSNHDWASGYFLADTLSSWFRNHEQVAFDATMNHRKYVVYGQNLIGFTHGDGARESALPNLMQHERREAWGKTTRAYWYCGHIHHKDRKAYAIGAIRIEKDHTGVTVMHTGPEVLPDQTVMAEYIRSPKPPDGWHHRNGYISQQAMECFLHHPMNGQVARFTEYF